MFKKEGSKRHVPWHKPNPPMNNMEVRVVTKGDEEKIKNILKEQPKLRQLITERIDLRNNFLKSQKLASYRNEISRLIGIEDRLVTDLRYATRQYRPVRLRELQEHRDRLNEAKLENNRTRWGPQQPPPENMATRGIPYHRF